MLTVEMKFAFHIDLNAVTGEGSQKGLHLLEMKYE